MIPFRPDLTRRMAGGADANSYHGRQMAPPQVGMAPPARLTTLPTARAPGIGQPAGPTRPLGPVVAPPPTAAPVAAPMVVPAPAVAQAPVMQGGNPSAPLMRPGTLVR